MAATFGGVAFWPERDGAFVPLPSREVLRSERPVPYSDTTILDIGGLGPRRWFGVIHVLAANVAALEAQLGNSGALVIAGVSYGTGTLVALSNTRADLNREVWSYDAEIVLST